ncbi:4'-phosphopantetheinyl transferase family protein [Actinoplanes sp. NPDC051859]|uniref:4'-phosphopantetheinyl transferase family protein n=1 Tax=Actinoplanes sp. NPDC051859 TaxID=3363909 RepID=UPI0037BD8577
MGELPVSGQDTVHVWISADSGDRPKAARQLLRRAGSALLGRTERDVVVGHAPDGRPRVRAGADVLAVSVSHSDGVVVVAARPFGAVGVDVERHRRLPAVALARRWYAPSEVTWLRSLSEGDRADGFLLLWTAKEAVGKALGRGLRDGGLRRLAPVPGPPRALLRPVPGLAHVQVGNPAGPPGLVLAVAVASPAGEVSVLLR